MADDGSDFARSMSIATSGLRAQAGRLRVISENIANAELGCCDFSSAATSNNSATLHLTIWNTSPFFI